MVLTLLTLIALDRSRLASLIAPNSGANASPTPGPTATPAPSSGTPSPSPSASSGGAVGGTLIAGGGSIGAGQALNFSAGGTAAVLLKDGGTYRAFERACTHQGTNVDWEPANGSFYCSNHGARFSPTGDVVVGPARTPLRPITVSVAADGSVSYTR